MRALWEDLRFSMRSLRKHALLSTVVIATLTLGVGFSAGIFTLINAIYLRAKIDKDHDSFAEVHSVYTQDPTRPGRPGGTTLEDYLAFRDRVKSLGKLAAHAGIEAPLGNDDPAETRAQLVTSNFFSLYDVERPIMGRLLEPEDCSEARPVVVLSERVWGDRFASDPQLIGKVIHFNGQPVTVVGVAPEFSDGGNRAKAWFPYTLESYLKLGANLLKPGEAAWLNVQGRLNPGFTHEEAAAELRLLASQQDRLHPVRNSTHIVTDGSWVQTPELRNRMIWIVALIIGILTILVLIICTNVTTLLLARAASRRQEIAVRLALGAGRLRLVRMLMTETLLLASIAGLASLYFTYHLPGALMIWISEGNPDLSIDFSLAPDWRVFGYLISVTLFAATLAGLAPTFQSLKVNLSDSLKGRQSTPGGGSRLRGILIGAQVALSFVLLFGAGGAIRTIQKMSGVNPGFETRHVLFTRMFVRDRSAEHRSWPARRRMLTERLEALPGVQSVAYASGWLFDNRSMFDIQLPGQATRQAAMNWVSPNFFNMLGITIVSGRAFADGDPSCGIGACPVVVSQKFASEFWPNADPLGKTFRDFRGNTLEVIGIARDVVLTQRLAAPDDPVIYAKWYPISGPEVYQLFVRFSGDEAAITRAVSGAIHEMAPEIYFRVRTIQSVIDHLIGFFGRLGLLVTLLGVIAVVLAVIGIYGIVSFDVARRAREIGIRIALGAEKTHIYSAILGSSGRPVALGLMIGLGLTVAAASALMQVIRNGPLAVNVHEPINYAITTILLAAVALAAMLVPARRATKVDPMVALRFE
jgi:predicted permease